MKILFTQPAANLGGSERYLVHLLPSLVSAGMQTEFITAIKEQNRETAENFLTSLEEQGIKVHRIYVKSSYLSPKIFRRINKVYKEGGFDALCTQIIYADFWGSIIKRFLNPKMKVFSVKHGYHIETYQDYCLKPEQLPKNKYYRIFKLAESNIDKSFACSHGLNDFHERGGLVEKGQMEVIEHGFNYPPLAAINPEYRFGDPQLVVVGRIIKLKGHDFVLEILKDLLTVYPSLRFVIVGSGIYEEQLKKNVSDLGLEEAVIFTGFQKNVMDYMRNSDIVLVPSYTESMPVVILEGFNSQNPVIAFDTIGSRDIIDHEETGILVPAYDTQILKKEILTLLNNKETRERLSANAYHKLKQHYSLKRMTEETFDFFKRHL